MVDTYQCKPEILYANIVLKKEHLFCFPTKRFNSTILSLRFDEKNFPNKTCLKIHYMEMSRSWLFLLYYSITSCWREKVSQQNVPQNPLHGNVAILTTFALLFYHFILTRKSFPTKCASKLITWKCWDLDYFWSSIVSLHFDEKKFPNKTCLKTHYMEISQSWLF